MLAVPDTVFVMWVGRRWVATVNADPIPDESFSHSDGAMRAVLRAVCVGFSRAQSDRLAAASTIRGVGCRSGGGARAQCGRSFTSMSASAKPMLGSSAATASPRPTSLMSVEATSAASRSLPFCPIGPSICGSRAMPPLP